MGIYIIYLSLATFEKLPLAAATFLFPTTQLKRNSRSDWFLTFLELHKKSAKER